jgi:uncharacterized membrane protein
MVGLGVLPGFISSSSEAVSADGSVIVGSSRSATGIEAFVWDATHGMRSLRDVLVNNFGLGASLTGWTLTSANDISADGQFIVGTGTNPSGNTEAWLARLAPTLPGDFNHDGAVDAADYVVWRKTGSPPDGYNTWHTNFGRTIAGGGSSAYAADLSVPESRSFASLLLMAAPLLYIRFPLLMPKNGP